ncbi:uncharacterized protein LOC135432360 [Drosophila montana]|uniref:uncharacterized protein LOC135432360 n=1 Tax=Drosophila montana TaxID=40370 RepID=UPI00313C5642
MWQLKLSFVLALALSCAEAKPSHHFDHFDQHLNHFDQHLNHFDQHLNHFDHFEPVHQALPDHVDYAAPLQLQETLLPAPLPAPAWPEPAHLAPAPAWPEPAHLAPAPAWPAPAPLAPAPLWSAPLAPAPAPVWPAPAPVWPAPAALAPAPLLPAWHLPTVTKVLPPVLEAVPFAPSYRATLGPKRTTHRVSIGYAFPKLLAAPHAHLRALPLKLAHHHKHHHSLF